MAALSRIKLVARVPKCVAVLSEMGLVPTVNVPEPNTWRELLACLDAQLPLKGLNVAVQEYGSSNEELLEGLRNRAAEVIRVPIYRWALPEDIEPLRRAVRAVCHGQADVLVFTSAAQIQHVLQVSETLGLKSEFLAGTRRCLIASVDPACTEELQRQGLPVDVQSNRPHAETLFQEIAQKSLSLLRSKRV